MPQLTCRVPETGTETIVIRNIILYITPARYSLHIRQLKCTDMILFFVIFYKFHRNCWALRLFKETRTLFEITVRSFVNVWNTTKIA